MYGLPRSVWWFVATAIIFVLQWIPFTGVFLMLLLAPLWSVVTINAGFVSLAIEAATGHTSRLWLLAPLAWFVGYALAVQLSESDYQKLDAEIRVTNARHKIAFDPARSTIAVKQNADDLGEAPQRLVQDYRLSVAYSDDSSYEQKRRPNELPRLDPAYRAYRIAGADTCTRLGKDARLRDARAYGYFIQEGRRSRSSAAGLCSYSLPEEPTLPVTRIEAKGERLKTFLLEGKVVRITITGPDGHRTELRSGQAAPLRWFPMPAMGCALNSGRPSWDCFAGFMKQSPRGLGGSGAWGKSTIEVIAQSLHLEAAPALIRREQLAASDTTALDSLLQRHEGMALANLDRLLADPKLRATVHDLAGLSERPHLLAPRADTMLVAMSAALAHNKGDSETARNLQRLIAALPAADFARVAPELLRRLDAGRPVVSPKERTQRPEQIDGTLASRLADVGPLALPLLERIALEPRGNSASYAIIGLCRMAPAPTAIASRLAEQIITARSISDEIRAVTYVTLVRWKRTDLADQLLDDKDRRRREYERR